MRAEGRALKAAGSERFAESYLKGHYFVVLAQSGSQLLLFVTRTP